tara:strand:+ start:429 stop:611 length:183 start_codon:yes stop_codon:yes gene_type:complete
MIKEKKMNEQHKELVKEFFIGLFLLILSPIYVPLGLLWGSRYEVLDFYIDCFRALTFRGL